MQMGCHSYCKPSGSLGFGSLKFGLSVLKIIIFRLPVLLLHFPWLQRLLLCDVFYLRCVFDVFSRQTMRQRWLEEDRGWASPEGVGQCS